MAGVGITLPPWVEGPALRMVHVVPWVAGYR
jgi:hypothetical protein